MNKQIEEIKKEFEEKFPELYVVVTGTPRLDGSTLTNRYKENAISSVWNFIEQAITKSNEEAVRGYIDWFNNQDKIKEHGIKLYEESAETYLTQKEEE